MKEHSLLPNAGKFLGKTATSAYTYTAEALCLTLCGLPATVAT
jgi:hypothetical protein